MPRISLTRRRILKSAIWSAAVVGVIFLVSALTDPCWIELSDGTELALKGVGAFLWLLLFLSGVPITGYLLTATPIGSRCGPITGFAVSEDLVIRWAKGREATVNDPAL